MRYLGGKHRQASEVLQVINRFRDGRSRYVEPFIGGGSVFAKVSPTFKSATAGDVVPDLVALWREVHAGWNPPTALTRDEWDQLRTAAPSALRAWAGYAASYNGKWFAGYGPTASGRDYLAESARGVRRKADAMNVGASFVCADYSQHLVNADTVVYCDPPYAGTESYGAASEFDHEHFWRTVTRWSELGALVLVHEYTGAGSWIPVYSRERVETMNHGGKSSGSRAETIFCHERFVATEVAA